MILHILYILHMLPVLHIIIIHTLHINVCCMLTKIKSRISVFTVRNQNVSCLIRPISMIGLYKDNFNAKISLVVRDVVYHSIRKKRQCRRLCSSKVHVLNLNIHKNKSNRLA